MKHCVPSEFRLFLFTLSLRPLFPRRVTRTSRCPRSCATWRTGQWCSWTAGTSWWRRVPPSRRRERRRSEPRVQYSCRRMKIANVASSRALKELKLCVFVCVRVSVGVMGRHLVVIEHKLQDFQALSVFSPGGGLTCVHI